MAYEDIKQYSDLVHEASTYGGAEAFKKAIVEKAIKAIEDNKYFSGYSDGHTKGILEGVGIGGLVVGAIAGGIYVGKKAWDGHKEKVAKKRKLEEEAQEAKKMLLEEDVADLDETETV